MIFILLTALDGRCKANKWQCWARKIRLLPPDSQVRRLGLGVSERLHFTFTNVKFTCAKEINTMTGSLEMICLPLFHVS